MELKTKFKPGDIAYVGKQKFLIVLVVVDENQVYYCGGRNPKDDPMVPEGVLTDSPRTLSTLER